MRWMVVFGLLAAPALGAECSVGRSDAVVVTSWAAEATSGTLGPMVQVSYVLSNNLPKGIRMVDASVNFEDVLGQTMPGFKLAPDIAAAAGGDFAQVATYLGMDRLVKARHEDIIVTVCTRAVVYEDGTKESFI
jgi:hypothetical protein